MELSNFENLPAQVSIKKTKKEFIEKTRLRGGTYDTVEIGYVIMELQTKFPLWDFEIIDEKQVDDHIVVKGRLTETTLYI